MDSFFSKGFKASKCKTLVKLAMARIKLLRNKRDIQVKQMRREIANLLQTGQEPSARIRVEHIIREQNIMAAYEIIELFCELIVVRLPIIESQRQCPLDLKEAIASLIFAAPRCADLPELLEVRGLFGAKYGKEFVAAAGELRPDCGVNRRIIEKLSVRAPSGETKLKLLKEIAAEHNVEWDPSDSEAELLKAPEDLLDGPSQFLSSSQVPLSASSKKGRDTQEEQTSVKPKEDSVEATPKAARLPVQSATRPSSSLFYDSDDDTDEEKQFVPFALNIPGKLPPPATMEDPYSLARKAGKMDYSAMPTSTQGNNQGHTAAAPMDGKTDNSFRSDKGWKMDYADIASAAQAAAESAERAAAAARAAASLAKGELSKSGSVEKAGDSDSDGEDDDYVENPNSLSKEKSGRYDNDVETTMQKDNVSGASKPIFDDYVDYDGPDVLDSKALRKARAEKQDSMRGWSSYKSERQSDRFKLPSQPDLPAQYDMFDLHSEQEQAQKEYSADETRLNFFSGKRGVNLKNDTERTPDYGPSGFQSGKGKSLLSDGSRMSKTKPSTNLEYVGDEEKNIVGQSSPSSDISFHSKYSESSKKSLSSQADRPSYDAPPLSPPLSPTFDDSHADAKAFPGIYEDLQGSTASQPPRRPPPLVPKSSQQNSLLRKESEGAQFSRSSSGSSSPSAPPVHPKLPDYDDLAARFLALKSSRS
ncbi:hypothetical protein O6H91_12G010300 [Diphasiastrum complanatum]|uniref:Uncharacterized protein n=1 Tax=Diphasiastrum complanatum TaxID=34168 RepID=A0ACC2BZ84_DIPCM|nr:hypothetical protein O6H91_12G010300 [Diphasiastrum complanatum]